MSTAGPDLATPRASPRPRFFAGIALLLLAIVVVGFSPTFYLRTFFAAPDLSRLLLVHGLVMTAWYVCFVAQTMLVVSRRIDLHRTLGVVGACLALGVIVTGFMTHFELVPRAMESGSDAASMARLSTLVWIDIAALAAFSVCAGLGLLFRADAAVHKRLMLLASISTIGPALSRIAGWPVFGAAGNGLVPVVSIALLIAPVGYDVLGRRRGRLVSSLGALFVFGMLVAGIVVGGTELGMAFTRALT